MCTRDEVKSVGRFTTDLWIDTQSNSVSLSRGEQRRERERETEHDSYDILVLAKPICRG